MKNQPRYDLLTLFVIISACNAPAVEETETAAGSQTPVTVTTVGHRDLQEFTELNATSTFMEKNVLKASTSGYIQYQNAEKGKYVHAGEVLFTLITKEALAIGNSISRLDPSLKFTGVSQVRASKGGYISDLSHQKGDYVQEGEQIAVISNNTSVVFLMDVPYELSRAIHQQDTVQLVLADGEHLTGTISSALPSVDSLSQTERIIVRVHPSRPIPENLIAKVRIVKQARHHAPSLPKEAVLTNETQDEFWVMKMWTDTLAVKVVVKTGLKTRDRVEILQPVFSPSDRILISGNYGLADTAKVKVVAQKAE